MRDHKSLEAWKQAHAIVRSALTLCRSHWRPWAAAVFTQLQRASLSIQLNIAEGHASASRRRFRNHLDIAYGSAVETTELLELLAEEELIPPAAAEQAIAACRRSQALLLGLIKRYRHEEVRGER